METKVFDINSIMTYSDSFHVIYRPGYGFLTVTGGWSEIATFAKRHRTVEQARTDRNHLMPPLRGESHILKSKLLMEMNYVE